MVRKSLDEYEERISNRVSVDPICLNRDVLRTENIPVSMRPIIVDLLLHGEVQVITEEKPEGTELHAGNTEFDFEDQVIFLDTRQDIITIPFERVIDHQIHYDE